MELIAKQEGNFDAIIAHSFGTLITSYALVNRNFPPSARLVYLGALNRLMDFLPRFQIPTNLSDEIMVGLRDMLYGNFGIDVLNGIANETLTPQIYIPAWLFHDTTDDIAPVEDSRVIAKAWRSAQLIETEGLGHRGALQSYAIFER